MILLGDDYSFHFTGQENNKFNTVPIGIDYSTENYYTIKTCDGSGTDTFYYWWGVGDGVGFGHCYYDLARRDGDGKGRWDERPR